MIRMSARKLIAFFFILSAILLLSPPNALAVEALPPPAASEDKIPAHTVSDDRGAVSGDHEKDPEAEIQKMIESISKIQVCVLSVCEEDPATEAFIRVAAESALLKLRGVVITDELEESSVMVSFVALKERDAKGMQTGRVIYSFAYGTPDVDFSDGEVVALPRYLYHEAVLAPPGSLEEKVTANINNADRDFFQFLRCE